jgi:hypothetical protein
LSPATNLEEQVPVFVSPSDRAAQSYLQTPVSLFISFYDSQGYGGVIPHISTRGVFSLYCDGLLKALRYGTRKPRVMRPTIELQLLSSEGLNNHDKRGTIEDIDS